MFRKTLFAFLFFCFIDLLLVSCCKDQFVTLEAVFITFYDTADEDLETINTSNFIMEVRLNQQVDYSYLTKEFSRFQNTAYATTCDPNYIVKNKATAFTIIADTPFYGIEAGMPLNSIFNVSTDYEIALEINNMLDYINFEENYNISEFYFTPINPLPEKTTLTFTILVEMENGESLQTESLTVTLLAI